MNMKRGRRGYVPMVFAKCSGIFYVVKMKLAFHAAVEGLELEAYIDSDKS